MRTRSGIAVLHLSVMTTVLALGISGYAGLRTDVAAAAALQEAYAALADDRNDDAVDAANEVLSTRIDSLAAHIVLSCAHWRLGDGELALVALRNAILAGSSRVASTAVCHGSELPLLLTRVAEVGDLAVLHWRPDANDARHVRAAAELDEALASDDLGRAMAAIACLNTLGDLDRLAELDYVIVELTGWNLDGVSDETWDCLA